MFSWNGHFYPPTSGDFVPQIQSTFQQVGYYRSFPCTSAGQYRSCIFVPMTSLGSYIDYKLPSGNQVRSWRNTYNGSPQIAAGSWALSSSGTFNWMGFADGSMDQASGGGTVNAVLPGLLQSTATYGSVTDTPQQTYAQVPPVPVYASGFAPNIKPENLQKPLSAEAIAAIVNAALAKYAAQTGQDVSDITVNISDVTNVINEHPESQPTLQDLFRPVADPAGRGGTSAQPVPNPTQVYVTNPQPAPGTSTGSIDKPDQDLDTTAGGTLGNPIQPILDFLSGPLKPFLHPKIDGVQGQCPVWTVDFRDNIGQLLHKDLYGNVTASNAVTQWAETFLVWKSDSVCGFLDDHYSQVQLFCSIALLICAFYWFFE
jgi:hypothetical protein